MKNTTKNTTNGEHIIKFCKENDLDYAKVSMLFNRVAIVTVSKAEMKIDPSKLSETDWNQRFNYDKLKEKFSVGYTATWKNSTDSYISMVDLNTVKFHLKTNKPTVEYNASEYSECMDVKYLETEEAMKSKELPSNFYDDVKTFCNKNKVDFAIVKDRLDRLITAVRCKYKGGTYTPHAKMKDESTMEAWITLDIEGVETIETSAHTFCIGCCDA